MPTVCMIAYSRYFTDPRVKRYVDELLKEGYDVDVFALGPRDASQPGLKTFYLSSKVSSETLWPYLASQLWFLFVATFRIAKASLQHRYAIVHSHNMPDFLAFAGLVPKLLGARVILDVHDTSPEHFATKYGLSLSHPMIGLVRLQERLSAAFADHIITTHELHKEVLVQHGIPSHKISIIMNLAREEIFKPTNRLKSSGGLTLIYHGTVARRLGLDLILGAIFRVRSSCPGLRFVLLGGGEYMSAVRSLISAYELGDIVTIKREVPVEALPGYLSSADAGIIGNRRCTEERHNYMLPVKMLEYAAMEIPTIAPRLRVIERYFDESNVIWYQPDSVEDLARCIRDVYVNQQRLVGVKRRLCEFNKRYNWSSMAARYLGLVRDLARCEGT